MNSEYHCNRTGRRFVGIERDPHFFEIARQRLECELAQPRLPLAPVALPEQHLLMDG